MKFLLDFFRQKTPVSKKDAPAYYHHAMKFAEWTLALYFLGSILLLHWASGHWEWLPAALCAFLALCIRKTDAWGPRISLWVFSAVAAFWSGWYIVQFGWGCGSQYLLLIILVMVFFNIYEPPWVKIAAFVTTVAYRMILYIHSLNGTPVTTLEHSASIMLQIVNSTVFFFILAMTFIIFSSNTQEIERQLRLNNQELHKEADTDPLTRLPNRRALIDIMDRFHNQNPEAPFSVAMADIDYFKNINDTYGHACGDYTLTTLADLFREMAGDRYSISRWGGEEFCFFLPNMNLDEAGEAMMRLNTAVSRMPLRYGDNEFSITITIGVEENDFRSPMDAIVEKADGKLYQGKLGGRNKVVL